MTVTLCVPGANCIFWWAGKQYSIRVSNLCLLSIDMDLYPFLLLLQLYFLLNFVYAIFIGIMVKYSFGTSVFVVYNKSSCCYMCFFMVYDNYRCWYINKISHFPIEHSLAASVLFTEHVPLLQI